MAKKRARIPKKTGAAKKAGKQYFQRTVLAVLLIISLTVFNFPAAGVVLAGESELPEELIAEENGNGEQENSEEQGNNDAIIQTGDANSAADIDNEVNNNSLELSGEPAEDLNGEVLGNENSEGSENSENNESGEGEELGESGAANQNQTGSESSLEAENSNQAEVANAVDMDGSTGNNTATSTNGDAIIQTGDANSAVNISNIANTNIFGSIFFSFLLNIFSSLSGEIDLSYEIQSAFGGRCAGWECLGFLNAGNSNQGSIENEVSLNGSTGGNIAASANNDAIIQTGDANAAVNIFNVLNSNIIGSNWTNLMINIFGDWEGDLVLPGQHLWQMDSADCLDLSCGFSIDNFNQGAIDNMVSVGASTGGNEASGETAIIKTGQAQAQANIYNIANANVAGGNWFLMLVNNFGEWEGNIFSLPPNFVLYEEGGGFKIYSLDDLEALAGAIGGGESGSETEMEVLNENLGAIKNNIEVNVSTGQNSAQAENGKAQIETGNASVLANLINVLNSNITGGKWFIGMINIFGKWKGNLAFGRPDKWIGISAKTAPNPATPGGEIDYTLTYANNGDADATGVVVEADYDKGKTDIIDAGGGKIDSDAGKISWQVDTLPVGGMGDVSYKVRINSDLPENVSSVNTQAVITGFEQDRDDNNSFDYMTIAVHRSLFGPIITSPVAVMPVFEISKTNDAEGPVSAGSIVNFQIKILNNSGGYGYDVMVEDVFASVANGEVVNEYSWDLGTVYAYEEIIIDYAVEIGKEAKAGFYESVAQVAGFDAPGYEIVSKKAINLIEVESSQEEKEEKGMESGEEIMAGNSEQGDSPAPLAWPPEPQIEAKVTRTLLQPMGEVLKETTLIPEAAAAEEPEIVLGGGSTVGKSDSEISSRDFLANAALLLGQNWRLLIFLVLIAAGVIYFLRKREPKRA